MPYGHLAANTHTSTAEHLHAMHSAVHMHCSAVHSSTLQQVLQLTQWVSIERDIAAVLSSRQFVVKAFIQAVNIVSVACINM